MKHTQDRGLVLDKNSYIFKVDAYQDTDFAGMYGNKNTNDPECTKSHTSFIITFDDCPVLWISKLKTENALYKMEVETIALDHCCREMFPIIDIPQSLVKAVALTVEVTLMKVSVK